MNQLQQTEALVLHAFDYREYDRILTLFTPQSGLIKIIAYGAKRPKSGLAAIAQPLVQAEFIYKVGRSELYTCKEASLLKLNRGLRSNLQSMESALAMSQAIIHSQAPGKPAPDLYALLLYCLSKLQEGADSTLLLASFRMRILRHEGLLAVNDQCPVCHTPLQAKHFLMGEAFCLSHAPEGAIAFSLQEALLIDKLTYCRSLKDLLDSRLSSALAAKVRDLFACCLEREQLGPPRAKKKGRASFH